MLAWFWIYGMEQKEIYSCENAKQSLFLGYYLQIIVLFSIWITINLLLPHPEHVYNLNFETAQEYIPQKLVTVSPTGLITDYNFVFAVAFSHSLH